MGRELLEQTPTLVDDRGEWTARLKDRLIELGFTYPEDPDTMRKAMDAVTVADRKGTSGRGGGWTRLGETGRSK